MNLRGLLLAANTLKHTGLTLALFLVLTSAQAMETDQVTCRNATRLDAGVPLNIMINDSIERARQAIEPVLRNAMTPLEAARLFRQKFRDQFGSQRFSLGAVLDIEIWMEKTLIPLGYGTFPTLCGKPFYIYDQYPHYYFRRGSLSAMILKFGKTFFHYNSANTFRVGNVFFGADKIGHFIDQGYDYWQQSEEGKKDVPAITYGTKTELRSYGMATSGVFSYGDLAANYAGYQFFRNLVALTEESVTERTLFIIEEDEKGELHLVSKKAFDIADYITPDWDEWLNPSIYSKGMSTMVQDHLHKNRCLVCHEYASWQESKADIPVKLVPKERYVDVSLTAGMAKSDPFQLGELCKDVAVSCPDSDYSGFSCKP